MKLVVNLPAYNEAERIGKTIKKIPRQIEGADEVFIQVIDDGSKDGTAEIAKQAGADFVYSHNMNRGIGITFRTAVGKALRNGADLMVNIDADGQFDPNDILKIIKPILNKEADLVSADRFGKHRAKNIPWTKKFLNKLAASLIGKFLNSKINDLTCGFRAYSRDTLLRLTLPGNFTYTQEVIIDAVGKNLKVAFVPVEVTYFAERNSRVVRSVYKYVNNSARIILKAVRDVRPMKFFGAPGLFLIGVSALLFTYFFWNYFQDFKISPFRNLILLGVTLLLVGIQLIIFAFIADMVKNTRRITEDQMYLLRKQKYKK
ncbi:undecaprenyl-phosphate mannosyltransferase [bacterium BMS3Abin15]|nr:undecaprenyl-phosphate mannosyltransferase [bacterium BMS3Abin15]HDH07597.1 glycosyltransferase family 2 protein [Candidatus Moranbacteria bacterium]HDZ85495.1 glycosyltransferase family 2 protein [Candidatus Moranbacteria bacterium]